MYRKKNSLCLVRHKVPLECHSGECIFQQEFENTVPVRCYVCVWAKVRCLCGTSLCRTTFVIHSHSFGSTIFVTTFTRCAECPDSPPTDDTNWNRCVCGCVRSRDNKLRYGKCSSRQISFIIPYALCTNDFVANEWICHRDVINCC